MAEFNYELKIPKERVAILIGPKGRVKRDLQQATNTKIDVDSEEGDVFIKGDDGLGLYAAKEVIKAVGRGFNPDLAMLLLKQDYTFEIIELKDFVKSKGSSLRLKGRVIGKEGKARRIVEELTDSHISVFGKTIGIIGEAQSAALARRAVDSLLKGSPHANVYRWLEKQRRLRKMRPMDTLDTESILK